MLKQHIQWNNEEAKYEHIFGTLQEQISVTILLSELLEVKERLLEEGAGLPGLTSTGQSDIIMMFDD